MDGVREHDTYMTNIQNTYDKQRIRAILQLTLFKSYVSLIS